IYSTPGISHSSFSIGLVTRSSTSRADAPGICTKTSTIGTMICGSSSRGRFHTAKPPSNNEPAITSGVSFDPIQTSANFPAGFYYLGRKTQNVGGLGYLGHLAESADYVIVVVEEFSAGTVGNCGQRIVRDFLLHGAQHARICVITPFAGHELLTLGHIKRRGKALRI